MDLYERVVEAIHGEVSVQTVAGVQNALGPAAWVPKVLEEDCIAAWQIIAVVLFVFGSPSRTLSQADERKLVTDWKKELESAARYSQMRPRDPVTLLPLKFKTKNLDWVIPLAEADVFMERLGHGLKVSDVLQHLNRNSTDEETPSPTALASEGKPLLERERTTYLNIIGGLLELMLALGPAGKPRAGYADQTAIINGLLAHYEGVPGLSKRNLEAKFADARRALSARAE